MAILYLLLLLNCLVLGAPVSSGRLCPPGPYVTFGLVDHEGLTYNAVLSGSGEVRVDLLRSDRSPDGTYNGELLPEDAAILRCMAAYLYATRASGCDLGDHYYFGYAPAVNTQNLLSSACLLDLPYTDLQAVHLFAVQAFCRASWCFYVPTKASTGVPWNEPLCLQ